MTQELSISEIGHQMCVIRGHRVMLDNNLAEFYQVETSALKRAVRRNITRFPNDFMFELTEAEVKTLICQIGISKLNGERRGGNRHTPFAFTEPGVAMLSSVLKSERAVQVNIAIMRAFIHFREKAEKVTEATNRMDQLEGRLEGLESKLNQVLTQVPPYSKPSSQSTKPLFTAERLERSPDFKIEVIQNAVAKYFGLTRQQLHSAGREISVARPRQIAMYLIRLHAGISFKEIGKCFGGRDHTTALHAYRKIAEGIEREDSIKEVVQAVESSLWN